MKNSNLQIVTVFTKDPQNSYQTNVGPDATWNSVREYFMGTVFNVSPQWDVELLDTCVGVQLVTNKGTMHFEGNITRENLKKFGDEMVLNYELTTGPIAL